ncbi:nucleopolyhedrovirus P10 family protein, partial [Streptomyces sp. SID14478]|nr:nucleopolyhedrovirus P10 family protein [Streptomyces sp. SID14478]
EARALDVARGVREAVATALRDAPTVAVLVTDA